MIDIYYWNFWNTLHRHPFEYIYMIFSICTQFFIRQQTQSIAIFLISGSVCAYCLPFNGVIDENMAAEKCMKTQRRRILIKWTGCEAHKWVVKSRQKVHLIDKYPRMCANRKDRWQQGGGRAMTGWRRTDEKKRTRTINNHGRP